MTWTTARPTKPGWYWWRDLTREYEDERGPAIYRVREYGRVLSIGICPIDAKVFRGEWQGPIEPEP